MKAGIPWEPQLADNAPKSQHLVVLWSKSAKDSDWVREETIRFKTEIDPKGTGPLSTDRRLFQILLQAPPSPTLTRYHAFTSVKEVDVAAGPGKMTETQSAAWNAIIKDIAEAANPPTPQEPWPVAVFAATTDILNNFPPAPPEIYATLEEFFKTVGIETQAAFNKQYDSRPELWKPFGSDVPMRDILDQLLNDVNNCLAHADPPTATRLRWQYVDLITTPFARLDDEVQKLSTGACLLIIDPLSLLVQRIAQRYTHLEPCFENRNSTILWLTPFEPHSPTLALRQLVKDSAQPLIRGYYEPVPPRPPRGRCALNVSDRVDMSRLFLSAVAESATIASAGAVSAVLSVGTKQP